MWKNRPKPGERIVKGMEHLGPVPEETAQLMEAALAQGGLKPGVPDYGMSAFLNGNGDAVAIATMGVHSLPKLKGRE